ncbi:hypothetical protein [Robiginitalea sp.]|uniref:hypothetical protein n=1 Tax=Robiginitalea sp. TaxID=1902411 RepID=UPI003C78A07C
MKKIVLILCVLLLAAACSGDDPNTTPGEVNLVFPENNSLCVTGIPQPSDRSEVTFTWQAASNADQYEIQVTLLGSATSQRRVTEALSTSLVLEQGAPYSWQVRAINQSGGEQTASPLWQFYNAGSSVSYPPFPARLVQPEAGSSLFPDSDGEILLIWELADPENDQESGEVFLGTASDALVSIGTFGPDENTLDVAVSSGQVYFWQVRTRDSQGNTSLSSIDSFRVL